MYPVINYEKGEFSITTDLKSIDMEKVYELLSESYWANNRSQNIINKSIENSLCFSLFHKSKQIGFFRVITDYATYAYLCDIIIDRDFRHKGLGKWSLECIFNHPELKNIKRWSLITKDAHEFYRQFGFTELNNPERYMELIKDTQID